jgi:hypothetical protein
MNIRTEEIHELDTYSPYIQEVVEILLDNKYKLREKISNEVFIKRSLEPLEIKRDEREGELLNLKTIPELQDICHEYGIRGITGISKAALIEKIEKFKKNGNTLDNMSLQELYELCKKASMIGYKKKSKFELIELLTPRLNTP